MIVAVMHEDQVETTLAALATAIAEQFPQHAGLPIRRVESAGTVVAPFRIGDHLLARVPLVPVASAKARERLQEEHDHAHFLSNRLPVRVPTPLGLGEPFDGYQGWWSLWTWLPGRSLDRTPVRDVEQLAGDLATLIRAFHAQPTNGRSWNGAGRGGQPLADTEWVRYSIDRSAHLVDPAACTRLWDRALNAAAHRGPAMYIHGDPMPGNLLTTAGQLSGMIDVSAPVFGDPAADLQPAWVIFEEPERSLFLSLVGLDDAARERAWGWTFEMAIGGLHYYEHPNPVFFQQAARTLERLLTE